ncbi:MAG: AAA family ATPase [Magnetococcales bacterium]|nr:AAA family ATPase [Magnetococcales bacterium]
MRIKRLHIENFRGIQSLDLELTHPVTVLVGENGAGKSSILDALATLLSWYVARIRSPKSSGQPFRQVDIRQGDRFARAVMEVAMQDGKTIQWSLATIRQGWRETIQSNLKDLNGWITQKFETSQISRGIEPEPAMADTTQGPHWPLVVHYSVNRTVLDIPLRIRTPVDLQSSLLAFEGALGAAVDFRSFFAWFRQREDLEHEDIIKYHKESDSRGRYHPLGFDFLEPVDPQLDAVRSAIEQFTGLTKLKIRRSPLHMEIEKNKKPLWVDHLSDGEKCVLAMIGDLARRLAIVSNSSDPLQGSGVVLIDEIDLHLHPIWQREIIPKLVEVFPNCPFIVSTHSPQVISDVRPEAVFLLRQENDTITVSHPEDSFGQTSDRILEDLMGVSARPVEIKEKLRSLFDQISKDDLDAAQYQLKELKRQIGHDPELTRADAFIRRKKVLGA